jgi:hypothetical protein
MMRVTREVQSEAEVCISRPEIDVFNTCTQSYGVCKTSGTNAYMNHTRSRNPPSSSDAFFQHVNWRTTNIRCPYIRTGPRPRKKC